MIRAILRLLRRQPAPKPRIATQDRHWSAKRRYAETHRKLAAELGIEWKGRE